MRIRSAQKRGDRIRALAKYLGVEFEKEIIPDPTVRLPEVPTIEVLVCKKKAKK